MDDFDNYLREQWKNSEFKKEWDSHELEYQLMMMVLKARNDQNLTQSELAERTGLRQSNISRIEKGQAKPSLATLCKIAHGLGKRLEIKFVNVKQELFIPTERFLFLWEIMIVMEKRKYTKQQHDREKIFMSLFFLYYFSKLYLVLFFLSGSVL